MKVIGNPQDLPFWYATNHKKPKALTHSFKTDVIIVGGGMAGMSAAQSFNEKGCKVVLLEKNFCGSGATGRSTGFITPESELDLSYFNRVYGATQAHELWEFVTGGVAFIEDNIKSYHLDCDYRREDTLIVANSTGGLKELREEHATRQKFNYQSDLFEKDQLPHIIGSTNYYGGVRYGGTFGINPYAYVQGMKDVLEQKGVDIYEGACVTKLSPHAIEACDVEIKADVIVVCVDYQTAPLHKLTHELYHAQTFVLACAPLSDKQVSRLFPQGNLMVWDTDLVYQYYRLIENNRIVVGGATIPSTFWPYARHDSSGIYRKLMHYMKNKFPDIAFNFQYMWPGLIGVSKDIMPVVGFDAQDSSIYYVTGATGLPWAAALGRYSAQAIIDKKNNMDHYFLPTRTYPLPSFSQYIIGKPATFALSNFMSLVIRRWLHKPKK